MVLKRYVLLSFGVVLAMIKFVRSYDFQPRVSRARVPFFAYINPSLLHVSSSSLHHKVCWLISKKACCIGSHGWLFGLPFSKSFDDALHGLPPGFSSFKTTFFSKTKQESSLVPGPRVQKLRHPCHVLFHLPMLPSTHGLCIRIDVSNSWFAAYRKNTGQY